MATARMTRHSVNETEVIAAALDDAAEHWPDARRSELPKLIITDWAEVRRRREALDELVGSMPGSSGDYQRSEDWPE